MTTRYRICSQARVALLLAWTQVMGCPLDPPPEDGGASSQGHAGGPSSDSLATADGSLRTTMGDLMAISSVVEDGDVETKLFDQRSGALLAQAWFSSADQLFEYTFLEQSGEHSGKGEVHSRRLVQSPSMDELNTMLAELWRARDAGPAGTPLGYTPYAPGCHFLTIPVNAPNAERDPCVQDCCAVFQSWEDVFFCETLPPFPDKVDKWTPCGVGENLFWSCIGACGLLPPRDTYGNCLAGQHRCFDQRCGELYCADDCFADPSPCDVKPTGANVYCNKLDGEQHSCPDGDNRHGVWAADCTKIMATCECRKDDKWRCTDDRCAAGRNGYCGNIIVTSEDYSTLPDEQECDPADVDNNPCCGSNGQPCCELSCSAGNECIDGDCVACGTDGQPPCHTFEGLRCDDHLDFQGVSTCSPCGFGQHAEYTTMPCCVNSAQYRRAGNDPCPDCSAWWDAGNGSQCLDNRCTLDCGGIGKRCCPEGKTYKGASPGCALQWSAASTGCAHNQPCQNGTCAACGRIGETCCPGDGGVMGRNYCIDGSECKSSKCVMPVPGMPKLQIVNVLPWVGCLQTDFVVKNNGTAPSGPFSVVFHLPQTPGTKINFQSLAPGGQISSSIARTQSICECALGCSSTLHCDVDTLCSMVLVVYNANDMPVYSVTLDDYVACTADNYNLFTSCDRQPP